MGCEEMFIKPREGLLVRGPDYTPLPATGAFRERNSYWLRRLRDGDVIICSPAKPKPAPPSGEGDKRMKGGRN